MYGKREGFSVDGIILTPLKQIIAPKGDILHIMKKSDTGFCEFGEAYFSTIHKGDIKGWKKHTQMTLNIVVPCGEIEFVIHNEATKEFFRVVLSRDNYKRLTIEPGLWMAFKGVDKNNILLNLASVEHSPDESINKEIGYIKYEWK